MTIPPRSKTREFTTTVPVHLADAFQETVRDFFAKAHDGMTPAQRAEEIRARDRDAGLDSLAHLLRVAESDTGPSGIIAKFLAGLYNGYRYRFDLTDFRALDDDLFEHCLAVLRLDHRPVVDVHRYFPDGGDRFKRMIADWNLEKQSAPEPDPEPNASYEAKYVTTANAPGYRDATLVVSLDDDRKRPIDLHFSAEDTENIARELLGIHRRVWEPRENRSAPIDVHDGECQPRWIGDL